MIDRPRILDAQRSGHPAKEYTQSKCVSILGSDPFMAPTPLWPPLTPLDLTLSSSLLFFLESFVDPYDNWYRNVSARTEKCGAVPLNNVIYFGWTSDCI